MIIMIILTLGTIHFSFVPLITLGFFIGVMKSKIKLIFQIGFKNGGYFLAPLKIFYVLKFLKDTNTFLNMIVIWFRLPIPKYYISFQNFKFLRFSIGTLFSHRLFMRHFPRIWQGNSKSNGGQISLIRPLSKFHISVNGYLQKILHQNLPLQRFQSQFFLMLFFFPELLFLLIKSSKSISNYLRRKLQRLCLNSLILVLMMILHCLPF